MARLGRDVEGGQSVRGRDASGCSVEEMSRREGNGMIMIRGRERGAREERGVEGMEGDEGGDWERQRGMV